MHNSYYRGFDDEMRAVVARNLEGRGIKMHPKTNLTEVLSLFSLFNISFFLHFYTLAFAYKNGKKIDNQKKERFVSATMADHLDPCVLIHYNCISIPCVI